MCGVVDLQVSRLGVCACLAPSLCWGLQGVVVPVLGRVGAVVRSGCAAPSRVCVRGFSPCMRVCCGGVLVCVLSESCLCELFGGESVARGCLLALWCVCVA